MTIHTESAYGLQWGTSSWRPPCLLVVQRQSHACTVFWLCITQTGGQGVAKGTQGSHARSNGYPGLRCGAAERRRCQEPCRSLHLGIACSHLMGIRHDWSACTPGMRLLAFSTPSLESVRSLLPPSHAAAITGTAHVSYKRLQARGKSRRAWALAPRAQGGRISRASRLQRPWPLMSWLLMHQALGTLANPCRRRRCLSANSLRSARPMRLLPPPMQTATRRALLLSY